MTLWLTADEVAALPSADAPAAGHVTTIRGGVAAVPAAEGPGVYPLIVPFGVTPKGCPT